MAELALSGKHYRRSNYCTYFADLWWKHTAENGHGHNDMDNDLDMDMAMAMDTNTDMDMDADLDTDMNTLTDTGTEHGHKNFNMTPTLKSVLRAYFVIVFLQNRPTTPAQNRKYCTVQPCTVQQLYV